MGGHGPTGPSRGPGRMIRGINVTPLVDIMLVLLIIVMVTAKFAASSAIPMDLPQASESDRVQTIFAVTIPAGGPLTVDGETVDREQLGKRAEAALAEDPDLRAVIQADGDVAHRRVMDVMDALRGAGLTRVAFGVSPAAPADESDSGESDEGTAD